MPSNIYKLCPRYCMSHYYYYIKSYLLLTWNSNLTGHPAFNLATLSPLKQYLLKSRGVIFSSLPWIRYTCVHILLWVNRILQLPRESVGTLLSPNSLIWQDPKKCNFSDFGTLWDLPFFHVSKTMKFLRRLKFVFAYFAWLCLTQDWNLVFLLFPLSQKILPHRLF